ncbi:MAG: hypothetical protein K2Y30_04200 [Flavobacteriaceae bacterium]|jgi:uncharacterized membrane protein YdcZ (DUF606 family)|uniref:Uncharacterized protein n=1 Tax=Flavobacterium kayseriense TaxID=2764714 RepID=A0ABR7JB75_9FLAO|nr:hypothetical protein [Flavobacterium kayseriense]MBC5842790.1 hypothetical protein [Flavobacterium kayseriense]MBC5849320.1 hypothetical protein [Flavobacterium kayseriense]MBU0941097.1 hypothetical protein [Bacteroidota bacterium]MBX9887122.1 hypothetical protein [Flavobacteriaceae bacterium]
MKSKSIGIVLVVIGALMVVYNGFNYVTEKKVVDIGPIEINKKENNPVSWSPILGGVLLVGGIILIVSDKKK